MNGSSHAETDGFPTVEYQWDNLESRTARTDAANVGYPGLTQPSSSVHERRALTTMSLPEITRQDVVQRSVQPHEPRCPICGELPVKLVERENRRVMLGDYYCPNRHIYTMKWLCVQAEAA